MKRVVLIVCICLPVVSCGNHRTADNGSGLAAILMIASKMKELPAVIFKIGNELVDPSRPNRYPQSDWYHKLSDEYHDDWDFSGAIANIDVLYSVGQLLADTDLRP